MKSQFDFWTWVCNLRRVYSLTVDWKKEEVMSMLSRGSREGRELVGKGLVLLVLQICDSSPASFEGDKLQWITKRG